MEGAAAVFMEVKVPRCASENHLRLLSPGEFNRRD